VLKKISKDTMYRANHGWLESRFHFSFAEYQNPENINFGFLRVLNDDILHPQSGFDMHPHRDMEIVTYIIDGELTHKDSMGNERTLKRGEVQYMSAGTGVLHSEYNNHKEKDLRLLQIWILPPKKGLEPQYGEELYLPSEREDKLLHIGRAQKSDAKIYVCELDADKNIEFVINKNIQIYFVQIEGQADVNGIKLTPSDAMKIVDEDILSVRSIAKSHFLFIEMSKENS
jgi:redox-sensitive bicupin YhaK (pirin superfamily)